jgi:hypothetical protein
MTPLQNSLSLPNPSIPSNLVDEHPHPTVASPDASRPTGVLPDLAVPGTVSPSTYLQSHTTSTTAPLNDSMDPPHPHFKSHMLGDGLPSQQRALPSQPCCISNATEARYQQQRRSSCHSVTTDLPSLDSELVLVAPSHSSADSVTSPSRVYRREEESIGVWSMMPTSGAHTWDRR